MRLAAGLVLNQELSSVVLYPFIWIILMDLVLKGTGKAMGDHRIKWGGKTLLDLGYADELSIKCLTHNYADKLSIKVWAKWMKF